ncbi:MAG: response regulator transcription factor [Lachnospiraceae bacterium]|nr:response regulator transcription factor [Lachnospiraceae bacterium]
MHIAICDDDEYFCEILATMIKKQFPKAFIGRYYSGEAFFSEREKFELLLLDIKMDGMNGMETAKKLRDSGWNGLFIFITGEEGYVFQAFDVQAFHYLVKPFSEVRLIEVLERAALELQKKTNKITVFSKGSHVSIAFSEILYAEVYDRKTIVHTINRDIEYYGQLFELENMAGQDFYRTHRSYLIHFKYLESYDRKKVVLTGNVEVPLAKKNYQNFVKEYMEFCKRENRFSCF